MSAPQWTAARSEKNWPAASTNESKLLVIEVDAMGTDQAYGPPREKPLEVVVVLGLKAYPRSSLAVYGVAPAGAVVVPVVDGLLVVPVVVVVVV